MTFRQLREGRDELILDPQLPIVDAHHHLFDRPALRYTFDDYLADTSAGHRIVASVFVEANAFVRADGPEWLRPLGEVEFANGAAAMAASGRYGEARICAAIIGQADLRHGAALGDYLDMAIARAPDRFRGVRQVMLEDPRGVARRYIPNPPPQGVMRHAEASQALRALAARGLVFETAVFHHQLPELAALADRQPDLVISLNHMGMALLLGLGPSERLEAIASWRRNVAELARRPNVVCKVGGLGLPFWGFGFEERTDRIGHVELANAWRPFVETAIEAFGPDRCMMESDYPIDSRSCGFVPLWNALKLLCGGASAAERAAMFHRTAARIYRLELPAGTANG